MYDSGKIIIGLIVFVGLFTAPFWYDVSNHKAIEKPNIILPASENQKECIENTAYMRSNHMVLLDTWRYEVVREGKRIYKAGDGKEFKMSLTKTCLNCHSNATQFCDTCHDYMDVSPYCWDCHIKPKQPENMQ
jgi:hypothetical protein